MAKTKQASFWAKCPDETQDVMNVACLKNYQKGTASRTENTDDLCLDDPIEIDALPGNEVTYGDTTITIKDENQANLAKFCLWLPDGRPIEEGEAECAGLLSCIVIAHPDGRACLLPGWLKEVGENQRTRGGSCERTLTWKNNGFFCKNMFMWNDASTVPAHIADDAAPFLPEIADYYADQAAAAAAAVSGRFAAQQVSDDEVDAQAMQMDQMLVLMENREAYEQDVAKLSEMKAEGLIDQKAFENGVRKSEEKMAAALRDWWMKADGESEPVAADEADE